MIVKSLCAAAGALAVGATLMTATLPVVAGPIADPFCKGSTPTPKHTCDALKAHEAKKPTKSTRATVGSVAIKRAR